MAEDEKSKKAIDVLWSARENLLRFLAEELIEKESVLTSPTGYEGAFGFEYQEIDNKFMGRLSSINTFIHNLQPAPQASQQKRATISNKVEVVVSAPENLEAEINAALKRQSRMRLVSTSIRDAGEGKTLAVLAFTSA